MTLNLKVPFPKIETLKPAPIYLMDTKWNELPEDVKRTKVYSKLQLGIYQNLSSDTDIGIIRRTLHESDQDEILNEIT